MAGIECHGEERCIAGWATARATRRSVCVGWLLAGPVAHQGTGRSRRRGRCGGACPGARFDTRGAVGYESPACPIGGSPRGPPASAGHLWRAGADHSRDRRHSTPPGGGALRWRAGPGRL
ncbi:MAG: maleylpyruvate isomerase N-terminal domain-containing protein [Anaerolineae bacterium]